MNENPDLLSSLNKREVAASASGLLKAPPQLTGSVDKLYVIESIRFACKHNYDGLLEVAAERGDLDWITKLTETKHERFDRIFELFGELEISVETARKIEKWSKENPFEMLADPELYAKAQAAEAFALKDVQASLRLSDRLKAKYRSEQRYDPEHRMVEAVARAEDHATVERKLYRLKSIVQLLFHGLALKPEERELICEYEKREAIFNSALSITLLLAEQEQPWTLERLFTFAGVGLYTAQQSDELAKKIANIGLPSSLTLDSSADLREDDLLREQLIYEVKARYRVQSEGKEND